VATAVRRAIAAHLGSPQVGRVIYGAIIGLAVVVVLEHEPARPVAALGLMLGTAVAVGLAEAYSEVVGTQTRWRRRVTRDEVSHIAGQAWAVMLGVAFPAVFFALAALGAMDLDTAFTVAEWSGVSLIGFYGFCAARLSGAGLLAALLEGAAVAAIGVVLIALKALIH
jgi:hypothetical protein